MAAFTVLDYSPDGRARRIVTSRIAMLAIAVLLFIVWPQFRWWLWFAVMWVRVQISDVL